MSRTFALIGTLTLAVSSLVGSLAHAEDLFPDKNLEAAVRRQVFEKRKSKEPLVAADVEKISTVEGRGKGIKNLKGLEACKSLAAVNLADNEIVDLSPLKDLKRIQTIDVSKNKIQDVSTLGTLTALQYIQIEDNEVEDISALKSLDNLRNLYADNNKIKDISALSGLTKMVSIYLKNNQVTDLKPLSKLKWLERLDISGNGVKDLTPLTGLTEWRYLFLMRNKIQDLQPLINMAKKDREGSQRFSLFWNVYLAENPLDEKTKDKQVAELKKYAKTVDFEYNK